MLERRKNKEMYNALKREMIRVGLPLSAWSPFFVGVLPISLSLRAKQQKSLTDYF